VVSIGIHIISKGFGERFYGLLDSCSAQINIISPFIGRNTATSLAEVLESVEGLECNIITRFYREDFIQGASSIDGIDRLFNSGAKIYALQDLHSKLFIFDNKSVITGSANFTFRGFYKNHEFGMFMEEEPTFANECSDYFFGLLDRMKSAGDGEWLITQKMIDREKEKVNDSIPGRKGKRKDPTLVEYNEFKFGAKLEEITRSSEVIPIAAATDPGSDFIEASLKESSISTDSRIRNTGIWIKFEGNSEDRVPNEDIYLVRKRANYDHMNRSFFRRRPRGIKKGQLVFMAVVSKDAKGIPTPMIVGYAEAGGYHDDNVIGPNDNFYIRTEGRYKYFIELHNGRYLNTPIKNGISLVQLSRDLGSDLYPSDKKDHADILTTHHQKSHIQITEVARDYLIKKLEEIMR
jgi:hypothetical protein